MSYYKDTAVRVSQTSLVVSYPRVSLLELEIQELEYVRVRDPKGSIVWKS